MVVLGLLAHGAGWRSARRRLRNEDLCDEGTWNSVKLLWTGYDCRSAGLMAATTGVPIGVCPSAERSRRGVWRITPPNGGVDVECAVEGTAPVGCRNNVVAMGCDWSAMGSVNARENVTHVLRDVERGLPGAEERLLRIVYADLRRLAARAMRGQRSGHTLQPTAVVHETYLRLFGGRAASWKDSSHFFSAAARAMRSILVDHVRRKGAAKRGSGALTVSLVEDIAGAEDFSDRVLQVHEALGLLSEVDARKGQVVELLFFGGLNVEQAGRVLGISGRTVKRDWRYSRAWLLNSIRESEAGQR